MPITAPPTIPQITDPSTFATRAQAWVVWQANVLYPALEDSSTVLTLSTSSTSTTSNTIGTGSKSFTVETGKGYLAGQSLSIAYTTTPTNRMFAVVTSYNSGTGALVVNVQAIEGSGTFTDWSIALAFNGVISTGQIANEAVTLAKIARVGTAGQVLTSGGAGADPSYSTIADASETVKGIVELATSAEYATGTDTTRALTSAAARANNIVQGTSVASTSGTAIDFTGIPAWVKRITVMFNGVSTNGTSIIQVQLGNSGGIENTGYSGAANIGTTYANSSSGAIISGNNLATRVYHGVVLINNLIGNTYAISATMGVSNEALSACGGTSKTLSATLDRIRITTVNGTDTFDAGSINILYE